MAMSAKYRSKFAALHRQWWHLHRKGKILEWDKTNPKKNKKQSFTNFCWDVLEGCADKTRKKKIGPTDGLTDQRTGQKYYTLRN